MKRPRLPASWLLLPLGVALHYPEVQTGWQGSYLARRQVCDLLAQGSVFPMVLPLLSPGCLSPSPQGGSPGQVSRPQPCCPAQAQILPPLPSRHVTWANHFPSLEGG